MLDFYIDPNAIGDLYRKYQRGKIDSRKKYYLKDKNSTNKIKNLIKTL